MLNKFLKSFFFISLVVAIAIAVLATLDATSYWFADMLAKMAYSLHGEIATAVVVFLPIAVTILCAILALVVSLPIHLIRKKKTEATAKRTKFFSYYFVSLIIISLLVLLFCMLKFNISERYIWREDIFVVPLLYGACIVEALVVAAFLVSFFTLWKTNRLAASIIGIIILFLIPANYISGFAVYEASSYDSSSYSSYSSTNNIPVEEYIEEVIEDYPDDVDEDYLSFLWSEGEYGVSGAANVLFNIDISDWGEEYPYSLLYDIMWTLERVKDQDTESYSSSISDEPEKRSSLNKIYHYLINNPSEAVEALASYKQLLLHYMPIERFYGSAAYQLLDYLSAAHEDLYSDNDLARIHNIYKLMSNIEHDAAWEYYDDIKLHINENYQSRFNDKDGDFYQSGLVWAYSFWARRNAEGTDDVAYTILNMLQDYYSEAEYYQNYDEEESDYYEEEEDYDEEDNTEND